MDNIKHIEKDFKNLLAEADAYREAVTLAQWDLRTKIPKKAVDQRSEVIGFLAEKIHSIETSEKMKYFIDVLKGETTDPIIQKALEECEENYERNRKIPNEEFREYTMLQTKAESVWETARENNDFSLFRPYLEKIVAFNKKFADYWGYADNRYDALLHNFEPGVTVELLDDIFPKVRDALSMLVDKINQSPEKPESGMLNKPFPKEAQKAFSKQVLGEMGYDFEAGRIDDTVHPFAITLNGKDVRITTRYDEDDFRMAVFGTIHEGGHALYEQNISEELAQTPLADGTSMGIHESQSLFWENFVGRNETFWDNHYEDFLKLAPTSFQSIDKASFYRAINEVKASFIRIEADELTYVLHIMVRYELEKALINDEIEVADLPRLWNEKMVEYLGIEPPTDAEGVLQDIHWAGGDFGYFPSYALGYMYAAQFTNTMKKEINLDNEIGKKDFTVIREWLTKHIHQHGKMKKPLEIVKEVTGEELDAQYLVTYLTDKYTKIYNL